MRIFSMHCGFNMDLRDFTLLWDFDDENDTLMNYSIRVRNTLFEVNKLTKHEIWKINNILNNEINTRVVGYIDFDDIIAQATERNVVYNGEQ